MILGQVKDSLKRRKVLGVAGRRKGAFDRDIERRTVATYVAAVDIRVLVGIANRGGRLNRGIAECYVSEIAESGITRGPIEPGIGIRDRSVFDYALAVDGTVNGDILRHGMGASTAQDAYGEGGC